VQRRRSFNCSHGATIFQPEGPPSRFWHQEGKSRFCRASITFLRSRKMRSPSVQSCADPTARLSRGVRGTPPVTFLPENNSCVGNPNTSWTRGPGSSLVQTGFRGWGLIVARPTKLMLKTPGRPRPGWLAKEPDHPAPALGPRLADPFTSREANRSRRTVGPTRKPIQRPGSKHRFQPYGKVFGRRKQTHIPPQLGYRRFGKIVQRPHLAGTSNAVHSPARVHSKKFPSVSGWPAMEAPQPRPTAGPRLVSRSQTATPP